MIEFIIEDHADQQFSLILEGRRVTMRLVYNQTTERWSFDLSIDDLPIIHGRRVVTGVDLLKSFDLGVGVVFAAAIVDGAVPDREQLANGSVKMFQTTEAEIASVVVPVVEPQTPNVRPIIWTPPEPTYFGQPFLVGQLLDRIEEGFAIDFINDEVLIRSNADPSLNFINTFGGALDNGKLEYNRASSAYRYTDAGLVDDVGNDVLRHQHDPLTGILKGVLIEPASVNNAINSNSMGGSGASLTVTSDTVIAPDGTLTADIIQETLNTSSKYPTDSTVAGTVIGEKYTFSVFAKKTDNPRFLYIRTLTAKNAGCFFDLVAGDWAGLPMVTQGVVLSRGFEKLKDDWFRVWITVEIDVGGTLTGRVQIFNGLSDGSSSSYTGDGVSGIILWGLDLRKSDRLLQYFPTSGAPAGPALDDFKIPLANIPWHDGTGEFLINGNVIIPNVVADKIVFPSSIVDPVRTVQYRLIN